MRINNPCALWATEAMIVRIAFKAHIWVSHPDVYAVHAPETYQCLEWLLLILKQVFVDLILRRRDLVSEHDIAKHEEGKRIAEPQDPTSLKELIQGLQENAILRTQAFCSASWGLNNLP